MLKSVVSPMIGESFTLVMAPTGEVQKVEGLAKVAEKMFQSVPQDPAMAGILDGLKANLSDEAMRSTVHADVCAVPEPAAQVWRYLERLRSAATNPMLGGLITSLTSTLKAVEGEGSNRVATIVTASDHQAGCHASPPRANPMGLTMQMGDGTGDGEQVFDAGSGRLGARSTTIHHPHDDVGHRAGRHAVEHEDERQDDHDRGAGSVDITDRISAIARSTTVSTGRGSREAVSSNSRVPRLGRESARSASR